MTTDFSDTALNYLLDELDARQRSTFEDQLTRYPGARIALEECADSLAMLRRQSSDLPFLGGMVEQEVTRLIQDARTGAKRHLTRGLQRLRQLIALS
jgi:hypothetical protein